MKGLEITDEIKQDDSMTADEQDDLFYTLLSGKTVKKTIETSRGNFVVKFPKQKDLLAVDKRVCMMREGIPATAFDASANFNLQKVAFLDVVVESGDKWFNNLKKQNEFSWRDMPDEDFVNEVYVKAWSFRQEVQAKLRGNETETDNGTTDEADVSAPVDDGLFSGVTTSDT